MQAFHPGLFAMLSASFSIDLKSTVTRRLSMTAMVGKARTAAELNKLPRIDLSGTEIVFSGYRSGASTLEFSLSSQDGQIEVEPAEKGTFTLCFQPEIFKKTGYRGVFDVIATFPSGDRIELCKGNLSVTAYGTGLVSSAKGVFGGNTLVLSEDAVALMVNDRGPKGDEGSPGPPGEGIQALDFDVTLFYKIAQL